jgi:hypothetical protein
MQLWLWVVSGVLWLVVIGLIGIGIRKLLKALKLLHLAGLNMFVQELEKIKYQELQKIKDNVLKLKGKLSVKKQKELQKLSELSDSLLLKAYEAGGEKGASGHIEEIWATRDIALAAAYFAMSSVVAGVSAVIIAVFRG